LSVLSPLLIGSRLARGRPARLAVVLAAALSSAAAPASASAPAGVVAIHQVSATVATPYLRVHTKPGTRQLAATIQLLNRTRHPLAVRLDPVDAGTAGTLGPVYSSVGEPVTGSALWLRLANRRVWIRAKGTRTVSIDIEAPSSAKPGDYFSGVSVQSTGQTNPLSPGSDLIHSVVGVELLLPGARDAHLRLSAARFRRTGGREWFSVRASNDGNVVLPEVHGQMTVTQGTRTVLSSAIGPGMFVSNSTVDIPIGSGNVHLTPGQTYRVDAQLFYQRDVASLDTPMRVPGHIAGATGGGWIFSVLLGLLLALLFATDLYFRRRRYLLPRQALLAMLERRLAWFGERRQPLSAIHVKLNRPDRATNRRVARLLRRELRKEQVVGDLWARGLLIVLPNIGRAFAEDLCDELGRTLADSPVADKIDSLQSETADSRENLDELVRWIRVRGLGVLGRSGAPAPMPAQALPAQALPARAIPAKALVTQTPPTPPEPPQTTAAGPATPVAEPLRASEDPTTLDSAAWTFRLREIFGAPLGAIGRKHIEALVAASVRADADLEFRAGLYGDGEDQRRELCRDIASMRNDRGGMIVLGVGVGERQARANGCPEVPLSEAEEQRMRRIVALGTAPHAAFQIRAIEGREPGMGFYALIAEPSPSRPHAVLYDAGLRYPRREGATTRYLSEIEVADLYRDRFRGEREQITRLGKITSEVLSTLEDLSAGAPPREETAWLVATLVPNSRAALTISAAGLHELQEWAQREHLADGPIDGFFEAAPAAGVGVERYTLLAGLDPVSPLRGAYLESHTDGAASAARVFRVDLSSATPFESEIVENALPLLRMVGRTSVQTAGSSGDAIIELRLAGSATLLASRPARMPGRRPEGLWVELASSHHTIPVEALAGEEADFLIAARLILADIFQAFGLAEVPHISPQGALRLPRSRGAAPEGWTGERRVASSSEVRSV
jgi:hypothetical protein